MTSATASTWPRIRRTAEAIVVSVREAAERAKWNEQQAKLEAQGLSQELTRAQQAVRAMEQRAAAAEERGLEAQGVARAAA
jgi:hypothetical protein